MEAEVNILKMQIDEKTYKNLYKVDVKDFDLGKFGMYMNRWKTFGIYESMEVAEFIADKIRKNEIII